MAIEEQPTIQVPRGEVTRAVGGPWRSHSERSPDEHVPTHYTKLLERYGHARMALRFTKNQICSLIGDYQHPDERIADGVRFALDAMQGTFRGMVGHVLDALWYGYDVEEKVWDNAPPNEFALAWYYTKIKPTQPESWYPKGLVTDDFGNLKELIQWRDRGDAENKLDLIRAIHWAYEGRNSVWGLAAARAANKWLETRNDAHDMWRIGMERLSAPIVVDIEPQGEVLNRDTGQRISYTEMAADGWNKMTAGGVLVREASVLDAGADGSTSILLPQMTVLRGDGWTQEFENYCDYAAREIYIAVGIPPLLVMEPEHASRAHTETIAIVTALMLAPIAETFVEDVLIDQVVRPLVIANYGEQETYGDSPVTLPIDEAETAQVVRDLWQSGFTMAASEAHYQRIQARIPGLLPEWSEIDGNLDESAGTSGGRLPNVGEDIPGEVER